MSLQDHSLAVVGASVGIEDHMSFNKLPSQEIFLQINAFYYHFITIYLRTE